MGNLQEQLIDAVDVGNLETVKRLVDRGADIHAGDNSALRWAAGQGHLDIVEFLVGKGANIPAQDEHALRWAANNGHLEVVKYLVEQGADIHALENRSLRWAAEEGQIEVVQFLVERGCPIDIAKEYGTDAVQDFCKAYELQKMLDNKLEKSAKIKVNKTKLKI